MKIFISLIFLFSLYTSIFTYQNYYRQRMRKIYNRIQNSLKSRERKKHLSYKHVFKINITRQASPPLQGHFRFHTNEISYKKFYNNRMKFKVKKIKLSDVTKIMITKWKRVKHKRIKQFTKFFFFPKIANAFLKNGKKIKLTSESLEHLSKIYLFLNNGEAVKVFASFSLYYNRKASKFYGTNKGLNYHVNNPPKNVWTIISIKNYYKDNSTSNTITDNANPTIQSPDGTLQMRRSESQIYYERLKKERLRRQQEELRRERERRRAEQIRNEQRNRRANSRNRNQRSPRTSTNR